MGNAGKSRALVGALLGVGLMLSGCGTEAGRESAGPPAPAASTPDPAGAGAASAAAATAAAATAQAAAAGPEAPDMLPLAELDSRLSSLLDAQGRPFTPVPQDQLTTGISAVQALLDQAVISPAECREVARRNLAGLPNDAVFTSGISVSDSGRSVTTVALVTLEDPAVLRQGLAVDAGRCPRFTIEAEGQAVTTTVEELPLDRVGEESSSYLMTQVSTTGETTYILGVSAMKGTVSATAQQIGADEPDGVEQDELRRLAEELLAG